MTDRELAVIEKRHRTRRVHHNCICVVCEDTRDIDNLIAEVRQLRAKVDEARVELEKCGKHLQSDL